MRRFYVLFLLTLLSCFSEENADLGGNFTFIRYFNGGGDDQAVAIRETPDKGYIILANTTIDGATQIKLIKTDELGNKQWSELYPPPAITGNTNILSYLGYGIDVLPNEEGFIIAGSYIDEKEKSELLILKVPADGDKTKIKKYTFPNPKPSQGFQGKAITVSKDASGNQVFIVLANILNSDDEDMALAEIKNDLTLGWFQTYGAGQADLTNKLFINDAGKLLWGGTVQHSGGTDMRFVRTEQNRKNTDFDLPIGSPGFDERGNDICNFGFGYAIIGNTNETATGDREIMFKLLADDGSEKISKTFPIMIGEDPVPGNKTGNAITSTQDWGFLLACTVPSDAELKFGRGEADIYLIKIDGYGTVIWEKSIGSTKDEQSVAVLQASDGGYIILGTSDFAGLSTVMLMKTDKNGDIQ
jgi:hypothetical protein